MNILSPAHKQFLFELLEAKINFILIGGYAVNYYGYARYTNDLDIWLKPDNQNKEVFAAFLTQQKFSADSIQHVLQLDFTKANSFHFGENETRIDFLTLISGVTYSDAEKEIVWLPLADKRIPVIQYHHLIANKMLSDRPKDKADVDELQKINQRKKK